MNIKTDTVAVKNLSSEEIQYGSLTLAAGESRNIWAPLVDSQNAVDALNAAAENEGQFRDDMISQAIELELNGVSQERAVAFPILDQVLDAKKAASNTASAVDISRDRTQPIAELDCGSKSGSEEIDFGEGVSLKIELTGNLTLTKITVPRAGVYRLRVVNPGAAYALAITDPSVASQVGGFPAGAIEILELYSPDGSAIYASGEVYT